MAVFDDRLNGENASKLKSQLYDQTAEIYGLENEIEWAEGALLEQKRVEVITAKLEQASKELEILTRKEGTFISQIEEGKKAIQQAEEEQLAYREEYRAYARKKAIGESFDEVELASGEVLKNVEIREVLLGKIRFKTEFGTKTIAWDDVSDEMRERFQIGEGELEERQAKLAAARAKGNKIRNKSRSERAVTLRETEAKKSLRQIDESLKKKKKAQDQDKVKAAAFRVKASEFRRKSASSNYNRETNAKFASTAEKNASALDARVLATGREIEELESEKEKIERELESLD